MKGTHNICEKCNNRFYQDGKVCEACVATIKRDILATDQENTGGCLTLLSKYVGDPIKNIASKMIAKQAVSKEYVDEANRRATFMYWWTFQLSDNRTAYFARWGFFYTGHGDLVRCFQCGIGIRGWSNGADPLEEHIRYSPNCQHLQNALMNSRSINVNQILGIARRCFYHGQSQTGVSPEMNLRRPPTENVVHTMMEENKALKKHMTCKVCCRDWKRMLFLPCQHLWVCQSCGTRLEICPCGEHVEEKIRVIFDPDF